MSGAGLAGDLAANERTEALAQRFGEAFAFHPLNLATTILHRQYKEQGVRFLLIHPGWMRTAMGGQRASLEPMDSAKGIYALVEKEKHKLDNDLFMDYNGTPRPW